MKIKTASLIILIILVSFGIGFFTNQFFTSGNSELISPFVSLQENTSFPLLTYSIPNLRNREYFTSKIKLEKLISEEELYSSYVFSYTTLGKKMTGQINIPDKFTTSPTQKHSAIIMIRGYVPKEIYKTGMGTQSAAGVLANNGYITIAPDFFGFGESDPEPTDTWQARFEKPIIIIELLKSLELNGVPTAVVETKEAPTNLISSNLKIDDLGIWAHSNGGQIALTTLQVLDETIPTTLWAPVTTPFPYSILYFSDELEDEGKEQRKWISMFEEKYNVFDFSVTQHLDLLQGPIQIQHGDADDSALIYWSEEFVKKIELENSRRSEILENYNSVGENASSNELSQITDSAEPSTASAIIDLTFYKYENTDHNMVPNWNKVIARDIQFFNKYL
ncbi:MAG: hypothetical protein COZ34_02885 [Candidatus Pacebacteria bacterium CG_4_10_14_3_um_filter_34_15]|nr:hypothetical protein [Candidatus Pacearchaeota archaeon]NCQ65330.1 hypothetical protein [Candidatus Paceibacterota bacterium]OIO44359.1 MAG: hypothetical protein AUJ41_03125 [Candidatus Pacebacteria bacterium CG1_02_43_31]PIQ80909.1 MAG: hypothetical protein COV78_03140 [Candidatus Pacebacteria bacterium CG11_big_fil_rev_8_21_14_0_20_34_55]PIX81523.1 MAG: hypothetical protein COZ34_02885 [Candidatus Pacebacteria bacterium CG_4_10_14_3_um_filter_34_15]PJC43792.1 MAG: hypothetical protein CO0